MVAVQKTPLPFQSHEERHSRKVTEKAVVMKTCFHIEEIPSSLCYEGTDWK
jgi:hypothetical protein